MKLMKLMKLKLFVALMTFGINVLAQEPGNHDLNTQSSQESTPEEMSLLDKASKDAMNLKKTESIKNKKKSKKLKKATKDQTPSK